MIYSSSAANDNNEDKTVDDEKWGMVTIIVMTNLTQFFFL